MSQTPESGSPKAGMQLWYCSACTRLINPPGSEGIVTAEGERYCLKCHGSKFGAVAPQSGEMAAKKGGSRSVIPAVKTDTSPRIPHPPHAHSHASASKPPVSPVLAFGLGGAAIFIIAGLMYVFSGKEETPVAKKEPVSIGPSSSSTSPSPSTPTREPDRSVQPQPGSGGLLSTIGGTGKETSPSTSGPANPTPPANAQPTNPTPQPAPAQPQPAPPAQPAPAVLNVADFQKELAAMSGLSNALKYSQALSSLKHLREKYASAPWWNEQQKSVADAEQRVQQQLGDFTNEVDDLRNRMQKSESLAELDKVSAEWTEKLKGMGGAPTDQTWIRIDPRETQSGNGATFTRQPDGSVLVGGPSPERDIYTFTGTTLARNITAVRIECFAHPSHPGVGRNNNANISLSKVRVLAKNEGGTAPAQALSLSNLSYDYGQDASNNPAHLIDEDPNSTWAIIGQEKQPHVLIVPVTGIPDGSGALSLSTVLEFQSQWGFHTLGHVRLSYTTLHPPPDARHAKAFAAPAEPFTADALVAKPIEMLLKKITERRAVLEQAVEAKQLADFNTQLDNVDRHIKSKPTKMDAIFKSLDTLETQLPTNSPQTNTLLDRLATLRFEAEAGREGDLAVFGANVRQMGSGVELQYDFSSFDQYMAFTPDLPDGGGGAWYDGKAGHVKMQVVLRRNWDGDDRRTAPIVRMPFLFEPNNWVFETAVTLVDDQKKPNKTQIGILVWDGGKYCARLSVRENSGKDVAAQLNHNTPNQNYWSRPVTVPGGIRETYVLNMSCMNGVLACSVRNAGGKVVPLQVNKDKLGFEPRYFGFFLRSEDDGENAIGSFDNARFTGQPLKEKVKDAQQAARNQFIAKYKKEWELKRVLPELEKAEREGKLGGNWSKLWQDFFVGNVRGTFNQGRHFDRDGVFQTHPMGIGVPFEWRRKVNLEAGKNPVLKFDVRGGQDFQLSVRVNEQEVLSRAQNGNAGWQTVEVPLAKFAGGPALIQIQNHAGGTQSHWNDEHAYWDNIRITYP